MLWENLLYALTQFVHNFGAVAVVGGAVAGYTFSAASVSTQAKLAGLVLAGWGAQLVSGLIFGAISLYFYGETPDLHSTAQAALFTKMLCAALGLGLAISYLLKGKNWADNVRRRVWLSLSILGATALTAAAILRWFS